LLDCGAGGALEIRIFDAQHESSGVAARIQPTEQRRAQTADVQKAGRTGSESGADYHSTRGAFRKV
jgi:hypothetical protein